MFGNLGLSETIVILGIALIVFGPRRLPEIGRTLGKALAQFRRAAAELRETVEREVDASQIRDAAHSLQQARDGTEASLWKALESKPAAPTEPVAPAPAALPLGSASGGAAGGATEGSEAEAGASPALPPAAPDPDPDHGSALAEPGPGASHAAKA